MTSNGSHTLPATSDTVYSSAAGLLEIANESGPNDQNTFVNYRILAEDAAGNPSQSLTFSMASNRAAMGTVMGTPDLLVVNSTATVSVPVTYSGTAAAILDNPSFLAKLTTTVMSGIPSCTPSLAGASLTGRTITLSNCTGNGTLTLTLASATATDAQNNASSASNTSSVITVDNTAPTVAITTPAASSYFNSASNVTVSGTCSENGRTVTIGGSGVNTGATPTCTSGAFSGTVNLVTGDGSKSITATTTDLAGNSTTSTAVAVTLDTTAPIVTVTSPSNTAGGTTGILFTGACETGLLVYFTGDVSGGTQTVSCSASAFTASVAFSNNEGLKNIAVSQVDLAGNTSAALNRSVYRDQTKPVATIGAPSTTLVRSVSPISFTVTFSDSSGSGVNAVSLTSGEITQSSTGNATCSTVNIDGTGTASRTVTLTGCTGNGTVSISLAAGIVQDMASNSSNAAGPSATVTVDNAAPSIAFSAPAENALIQTAFTLTGTCESGLTVTVSSPGIASSPQTGSCNSSSFSMNLTLNGSDGNKLLTVSQTDAAGNIGQLTRNLVRDTTAPVVAISSPAAANVFYNTNVLTTLSGSCETGLTVNLEGDVVAGLTTTCAAGSFSFSNWTLSSGDGSKTVTASQTDSLGQKGTGSRIFSLATAPIPGSAAVTFNSVVLNGLHGTITGACDSSGAYSSVVAVTSANATVFSQSCISNLLTVNLTNMLEGRNSIALTATVTRLASGETLTSSANFNQQFFCPQGYVGVPGKFSSESDVTGLGHVNATAAHADGGLDPTRDFCVMKYQAKVATSNASGQSAWEPVYNGNKTFTTMSNYWPQSRADSTPWVNISRDNSIDRCKALNEAHGLCTGANCYTSFDNTTWGYRLMSNTQWQVAARNMANTGGNWTSGTVGSGFLWRGQSDDVLASNTDLHNQTYSGATQKTLSNPRSDTLSDYFGTGNTLAQGSSASSGWQERRRFVFSNGSSVWDFSGNAWQWVSDNNDLNAGNMGVSSALRASNTWWEYNNGSLTTGDKLLFGNSANTISTRNAGQIMGSNGGSRAVLRGSLWYDTSYVGMFATHLGFSAASAAEYIGFRCAFLPPLVPTSPADTTAPGTPALGRVDEAGDSISNTAVTIASGGLWHLQLSAVTDAQNTGTNATKLRIKVRRKIATLNNDFPTASDPVYRVGYNSPSLFNRPDTNDLTQQTGPISFTDGKLYLSNETAWAFNEATGQYARNDARFVNYRVEVYDPAGNSSFTTYSVEVTQSCPPGYVGVPGKNSGDSDTPGLGNVNASAGNTNVQLDPTKAFCVMKYPAKVMSAGTTAAASTVGGRFEPIMNGNNTFANTYTYTNSSTFNSGITYLPSSRYSGTPWVFISRDDSINACRALQMQYFGTLPDTGITTGGTGFQLMSNTQWQVVARDAESVSRNWSYNAVGQGNLARGHTDNAISATGGTGATEPLNSWCFGCSAPSTTLSGLPNAILDLNGYFATGNTASGAWNTLGFSPAAGTQEVRTRSLSNGNTVWDFGGNVWQWVLDNNCNGKASFSTTPSCASDMGVGGNSAALNATLVNIGLRAAGGTQWEYNNGGITPSDRLLFSPLGNYTSSKNVGMIRGAAGGAVRRGGNGTMTTTFGLYGANLVDGPSTTGFDVGFRCSFVP